jgi:transcription elongation factor Elf1
MKKASGKSNLSIVKDYLSGERPFTTVGYDPNLENGKRKEGEEWEDSQGYKWVWKHGYKKSVSKRATIINEKRCKTCNMDVRWGNYLDDRVWPKTTMCYDCFTKFQTDLKLMGMFEVYNELHDLKNERSILEEYKRKFEESQKFCQENQGKPVEFLEEDGSFERWEGNQDYTKILVDVTTDLVKINEGLNEINAKIKDYEEKYESAKSQRYNKK